jgi:RecA-family ATPase
MNRLPVAPAYTLAERAEEQRWLVDGLWSEEAVGIIGGEPKCCKSFLALDLAVSIAAGTPCLRRFAVQRPGCVLLYAAEDALHIVRRRLDGICAAAGRRAVTSSPFRWPPASPIPGVSSSARPSAQL